MDINTDRRYKDYSKISRYSVFPIYYNSLDERWFGGMTSWLRDDTVHVYHTVKVGDTLDILALHYYGNPTYFWIIADFNRINDPFASLEVGSTIKIPTFSAIEFNV